MTRSARLVCRYRLRPLGCHDDRDRLGERQPIPRGRSRGRGQPHRLLPGGRALRRSVDRHGAVAFDGYDEGGGAVLVVVAGGAFFTLRVRSIPGWKVQTIL